MQNFKDISAVILASGFSERMKMSKAELQFDKKQIFFQKTTDEYLNFGCKEVIVVMNYDNFQSLNKRIIIPAKIKIVINKNPERGKFSSLKTGIFELSETQSLFIQNIDNPFVNQKLLKLLSSNSAKAHYIIPSYQKKGGHPILLSKQIIKDIKKTEHSNYHLKNFLNKYRKIYIKTDDEKVLVNINTISEYHLYF